MDVGVTNDQHLLVSLWFIVASSSQQCRLSFHLYFISHLLHFIKDFLWLGEFHVLRKTKSVSNLLVLQLIFHNSKKSLHQILIPILNAENYSRVEETQKFEKNVLPIHLPPYIIWLLPCTFILILKWILVCINMFSKNSQKWLKPPLVNELKWSLSNQFIWYSSILTRPIILRQKNENRFHIYTCFTCIYTYFIYWPVASLMYICVFALT
jgi:hypothetical protein